MSSALRRQVLIGGGTVLSVLLGGCSNLPLLTEEPQHVQIEELSISNLDDQPHVFDVMIRDVETDQVVFWETYKARAMTDRDGDGRVEAGGTVWKNPLESPGDYVLYAHAEREVPENDNTWESARLATAGECLSIEVEVDRDEYLSIEHKYPESC